MMKMSAHPSPNHDARPASARVSMLVLHYTGMESTQAALARLCDAGARVSAHYLVDEAGGVFCLVDETRRAWHAGEAFWAGERDVNAHSIGIELANPGHEFGYPDFTAAQMDALLLLCRDICARVPIAHVLGHSDVAPQRKKDPGEKFDWGVLARAGIGRVVSVGAPGAALKDIDVRALQRELARIGYDSPQTGIYDDDTRLVVAAFQRHFRPARVDGLCDASTLEAVGALVQARNGGQGARGARREALS